MRLPAKRFLRQLVTVVEDEDGSVVGRMPQDELNRLREAVAKANGFPTWEEFMDKELRPKMEELNRRRQN